MKVVLIGPAFPLRGGIADFNEALSNAFIDAGHSVSIYSFYFQYPSFLFPGTSQKASGNPPENLDIHPTLSSVNPISWFRTAGKIAKESPDLVIIRYWLPFMAPALGTVARRLRKKGIRVIAITDNVIPHEHRMGDSQLTSYFVKGCQGFVTMSSSVLKDLEKFTATDKKVFLPHPIYNIFGESVTKSEAREQLGLDKKDRIILFFGFIRKYKGLHLLIDAMGTEEVRKRNIKLLVAGEYYEDPLPYKERIHKLKLDKDVILHTKFIDKNMVRYYFCACDLVVQPYLTATQSGITQVAYHFGRPMLVTRVGGLAEIVQDKRDGYVTGKDAHEIAAALCDFYDQDREEALSKNVVEDSKRFSWNHFVEGVIQLYRSL